MTDHSIKILQLSDLHLFADPRQELLGVNTSQSLDAVLAYIRKHELQQMDLMILSGDLSQDYSAGSYERLLEKFQDFAVPIYWVPGNHDDGKLMHDVLGNSYFSAQRHLIFKEWHVILLDSHVQGEVKGYLDESQLHFMEECLQAYPEHEAIVVFHHHPVSVGSAWLDRLGVVNADTFWHVAERYPKLKTVLFGHVHQEFFQLRGEVKCYGTPATCLQFMRQQYHFGLEHLPPGYRRIYLYPDGKFKTSVQRIAKYVGHFDAKATGY